MIAEHKLRIRNYIYAGGDSVKKVDERFER